MAQGNPVNFYKTADIESVTLPDDGSFNGSFIYDTSDDGFYIIEKKEKHRLNTKLSTVMIPVIKFDELPVEAQITGLKIQEGLVLMLIYTGGGKRAAISNIKLNGQKYSTSDNTSIIFKPSVPKIVMLRKPSVDSDTLALYEAELGFEEALSTTKGGTDNKFDDFAALAAAIQKEAGVTVIDAEVDVPKDGWSGDSSGVYTNTISNITDLLTTDRPIIDVSLEDGSAAVQREALTSYQCVSKIEVSDTNKLKLTALSTKPTSDFKLKIKIIRDNSKTPEATT